MKKIPIWNELLKRLKQDYLFTYDKSRIDERIRI